MYDITDQENIWQLAQMIAAETTGLPNAHPSKDDIDLARVVAGHIKQVIYDTHPGCIIRGEEN